MTIITDQDPSPRSAARRQIIANRRPRPAVEIHPESPIGRLQAQLEAAKAAPVPVREELRRFEAEAAQLDAWLEAADADTTEPADYVIKWGGRELLGRGIAKRAQSLAVLEQTLATIEAESRPVLEALSRYTDERAALQDPTSEGARRLPRYLLERRLAELAQWFVAQTGAPAQGTGSEGA